MSNLAKKTTSSLADPDADKPLHYATMKVHRMVKQTKVAVVLEGGVGRWVRHNPT